MSKESPNLHLDTEREFSLSELLCVVLRNKWLILTVLLSFSVVSAFVSLQLPNKYRSEATLMLAQSSSQSRLSSLVGQLGGLASLAGLDLSGAGSSDRSQIIIETLNSRQFIVDFIRKNDFVIPLFAGADETADGVWNFDPDIYDINQKKWTRDVSAPFVSEPSDWEIYETFRKEALSVDIDKKTGILRLSIRLRSASAAKLWVDRFVIHLNDWMRRKSISEKEQTISYLTEQIERTTVADMQKIFFSLIEKEQTEMMLAKTQEDFALKVVDPAIVSPMKSEPKRSLIVVISSILGLLAGILVAIVSNHFRIKKTSGIDEKE